MTWILGTAVPFGYGARIADVRVSWPNGKRLDVLQKVHTISPWIIAGFAGSVEFGFQSIGDLQHCFPEPTTERRFSYFSRMVAWKWYRRLRRAYATAPLPIRRYPFSLMLAAAEPTPMQPFPLSRCIRMSSLSNPPFEPQFVPAFQWWSIGSGSTHIDAAHFANMDMKAFAEFWGKGEIQNPGGGASMIASSVIAGLKRNPKSDVGGQIQIGCAFSNRFDIRTLDVNQVSERWRSEQRVESTGLARTWEEFKAVADANDLTANAAAT